jgi:YT521-B-like domain
MLTCITAPQQGYARMTSAVRRQAGGNHWAAAFGDTFTVEWLRVFDLPHSACTHLRNPYKDNDPVHIARQAALPFAGRGTARLFVCLSVCQPVCLGKGRLGSLFGATSSFLCNCILAAILSV